MANGERRTFRRTMELVKYIVAEAGQAEMRMVDQDESAIREGCGRLYHGAVPAA